MYYSTKTLEARVLEERKYQMNKLEYQYLDILEAIIKDTMPSDTLSSYVRLSSLLARDLKSLGYKF